MRLACTCGKTCEFIWPPNASLYARWTCIHLRLLAGPGLTSWNLRWRCKGNLKAEISSVFIIIIIITVRPLLSGHLLGGHPPLSGHFSKSRIICQLTVVFDTSIQRPPLLSGRGHHFAVASVLFIWFLTSTKRPADYLYKHLTYYLNKSSVKYLERNFLTYELLMLKGLRNMSTMFCTFSVHYQPEEILYISTTCSLY